jgi:hypothetical protein
MSMHIPEYQILYFEFLQYSLEVLLAGYEVCR